MNIQCPKCQQVSELAFEIAEGRHVRCPYCGVKFAYGASGSSVTDEAHSHDSKNVTSNGNLWLATFFGFAAGFIVAFLLCSGVKEGKATDNPGLDSVEIPTGKSGLEKYGWVVYEDKGKNGEREIKVLINPVTKKNYLKDCFGNGFLIVIRPEDMIADLYFHDDKANAEDESFLKMGRYHLFKEVEWKEFCEKICEFIKAKPAKGIIAFVARYR